ncbi:MAG: adenylyltransferase/cytidyltransferase family protein [Candidatus Pacearchaeota archaeon]
MNNKIRTLSELKEILRREKENGKIIVTTNGSFDLMHSAHVALLEKAKKEGDILIVLLNSDASIKRNKGEKRPIIPQEERAKMLAGLASVDYIIIFEEDKPLRVLEEIKPNKHVKGGTFLVGRINEERDLISNWGGEFKHFELESGFSTTEIIETILQRYGNSSLL